MFFNVDISSEDKEEMEHKEAIFVLIWKTICMITYFQRGLLSRLCVIWFRAGLKKWRKLNEIYKIHYFYFIFLLNSRLNNTMNSERRYSVTEFAFSYRYFFLSLGLFHADPLVCKPKFPSPLLKCERVHHLLSWYQGSNMEMCINMLIYSYCNYLLFAN